MKQSSLIIISVCFINLTFCVNNIGKSLCPKQSCAATLAKSKKSPFLFTISEFEKSNCFCDVPCSQFGDCCKDSNPISALYRPISRYICKDFGFQFGSYYVKKSCVKNFHDHETIKQCLYSNDSFSKIPVSNIKTHITYSNIFCAACNRESEKDLRSWNPFILCSPQLDEVIYNVEEQDYKWHYNSTSDSFYFKYNSGKYVCKQTTFVPPKEFKGMPLRKCKHAIDSCMEAWTNKTMAELCKSYTDYRYFSNLVYKNKYCALCNNISLIQLKCIQETNDFWLEFPYTAWDWANFMDISCLFANADIDDEPSRRKIAQNICLQAGQCFDEKNRSCFQCPMLRMDSDSSPNGGDVTCFASVMIHLDARYQSGGHVLNVKKQCRKGKVYDPFKEKCIDVVRRRK